MRLWHHGGVAGRGTPALAAARRASIAHRVHEYAHDPAAPSFGREAADVLGVEPGRVGKTLVVAVDGRLVVAVLAVDRSLSLKALAQAAGGKRAEMADPAAAERATGYVVGAISPLGQRRRLPIFVDAALTAFPTIYVSAGRRGLELELLPADLVRLTAATVAALARDG